MGSSYVSPPEGTFTTTNMQDYYSGPVPEWVETQYNAAGGVSGTGKSLGDYGWAENEKYLALKDTGMDGGSGTNVAYSSDAKIATGQAVGRQRGQQLYGMDQAEVGTEIQDIISRRKGALDSEGPESTQIAQARNKAIRDQRAESGRSGVSSDAAERQLQRDYSSKIGEAKYKEQEEALSNYQSLMGNVAANMGSLEMGFAGLEKAGDYTPPPMSSDGGTIVICTELGRQGLVDTTEYHKCHAYSVMNVSEDAIIGYHYWAIPYVELMKKSRIATAIVRPLGIGWVKQTLHRSGKGKFSLAGYFVEKALLPICDLFGKLIKLFGGIYV